MSPQALMTLPQRKMITWAVTIALIFVAVMMGKVEGGAGMKWICYTSFAFMGTNGMEWIGKGIGKIGNGK